ncbi:MAG: hypothetical protein ACOC0P_01810 [Planctomycetota bacterium]
MKQRTRIKATLIILAFTVSLYAAARVVEPAITLINQFASGKPLGTSDVLLNILGTGLSGKAGEQAVAPERLIQSLQAVGLSDSQIALFAADLTADADANNITVNDIMNHLRTSGAVSDDLVQAVNGMSAGMDGYEQAGDRTLAINDAQMQELAALLNGDAGSMTEKPGSEADASMVELLNAFVAAPTTGTPDPASKDGGTARLITKADGSDMIMTTVGPASSEHKKETATSSESIEPNSNTVKTQEHEAGSAGKMIITPSKKAGEIETSTLRATAASLHEGAHLPEAIIAYRELLRREPEDASTHLNIAYAYYQVNDDLAAWKHIERAQHFGRAPHPQFVAMLSRRTPDPRPK